MTSRFLTITADSLTYHDTAREAVHAAGLRLHPEGAALQSRVHAMNVGDEFNVSSTASIIKITGVEHDA